MIDPIYVYFGALAGALAIGVGVYAWGWLASEPYIRRQNESFKE